MVELLRRVLFLGGLLVATAMALQAAPLLVRVAPEDMTAAYQRARAGKDGFLRRQAAKGSLDAFVAARIRGRVIDVSGPAWAAFFTDLEQAAAGATTAWAARRGESYARASFFFRPDEAPLDAVVASMTETGGSFSYLRMAGPDGPRYAGLTLVRADDAATTAPATFAHPYGSMAPWAALVALAAYWMIPRPRRGDERTLTYRRSRAVVIPDFLGAVLASLFFGLPFLIVGANSPSGSVFQEGWVVLTAIFWMMAAGAASLLVFAARYAAFRLALGENGLHLVTLSGSRHLPFADIVRAEFADYRAPRWLRRLLFIGGALDWRLTGQALLLEARGDWGIALVLRDGRRFRIMTSYLDGTPRLVETLENAGVPVAAAIRDAV